MQKGLGSSRGGGGGGVAGSRIQLTPFNVQPSCEGKMYVSRTKHVHCAILMNAHNKSMC